jgi:DNA invertase Pin-like site-specific DNA recombinase
MLQAGPDARLSKTEQAEGYSIEEQLEATRRLCRNQDMFITTEQLGPFGWRGVGYLSTTEQMDYSTPQGMLVLQTPGAFNEYYAANWEWNGGEWL